jgi:hypothetical protein
MLLNVTRSFLKLAPRRRDALARLVQESAAEADAEDDDVGVDRSKVIRLTPTATTPILGTSAREMSDEPAF